MKELTILSGKGGTGKTSLTASFAALAPSAVLVDADVDAPDLHLIMQPTPARSEPFSGGKLALLNPATCIACGRCADVCRFGAVSMTGPANDLVQKTYAIDALYCEGCAVCMPICPGQAITMTPANSGEWFVSQTRFGWMFHARLHPGQGNSGKLVSLLRKEAKRLAELEDRPLIITDAGAGIGCPVIAALGGTSLCVLVIEPTVSGLHDARRAIELIRHFRLEAVAVINKADLNPELADAITEEIATLGVDTVGRIPYDEAVVDAQMREKALVEHVDDSPATQAIRMLWDLLSERLKVGSAV